METGSKSVKKDSRKKVSITKEPIGEKTKTIEEILESLRQPPSDTFKAKLKLKIGNNTADINSGANDGKGRIQSTDSRKQEAKEQGQGQASASEKEEKAPEAEKEEKQDTGTIGNMQSLNLPLPMNPNFKVYNVSYFGHTPSSDLL